MAKMLLRVGDLYVVLLLVSRGQPVATRCVLGGEASRGYASRGFTTQTIKRHYGISACQWKNKLFIIKIFIIKKTLFLMSCYGHV